RNFFTTANFVDQRKIGRSQQAEVLAILLVDALNVFGDDDANTGAHLGVRRLLAAGTFTAAFAADGGDGAALLDIGATDGRDVAALQAQIGNLAQRLVKIETIVGGRDFVGGDVVAELGIVRWVLGVPG